MEIKSLCPFCGVGCGMYIVVEDGIVKGVNPDKSDPVSLGSLCLRGLAAHETIYSGRIEKPLARKNGRLEETSFEEAYKMIYDNLKNLDGSKIAVTGNPQATNESNYVIQKFGRAVLKTNNIDTSARLCHAASCHALNQSLGISVMPKTLSELEESDCILLVGTNPQGNYPIAFQRILRAKNNGAKIISIQPIFNASSQIADVFVKINSGTHLFCINTILGEMIRRGYDVDDDVENFLGLESVLRENVIEDTQRVCGCNVDDLEEVIRMIGESKKFSIMYGMGMTQHSYGIDNAYGCINLAIAKRGNIFPMRGKSNVQGASDMGCDPSFTQRLQKKDLEAIERLWNVSLRKEEGRDITETAYDDTTEAFLIFGMNPAQSLPELERVWKKLSRSFVIVINSHFNKTCEFADIILPSSVWAEDEGTFTNAEGRVRKINRAIFSESKSEWRICGELSKYFDYEMDYEDVKKITKEIIEAIPEYRSVSLEELNGSGSFREKGIKHKRYFPVQLRSVENKRCADFPLILITARSSVHFCTGWLSRNSERLNRAEDECFLSINVGDASEKNISPGDIVRIVSSVGAVEAKVRISENVPRGTVTIPYHFKETPVNRLIPLKLDPMTGTPNYKTVPVRVEKV